MTSDFICLARKASARPASTILVQIWPYVIFGYQFDGGVGSWMADAMQRVECSASKVSRDVWLDEFIIDVAPDRDFGARYIEIMKYEGVFFLAANTLLQFLACAAARSVIDIAGAMASTRDNASATTLSLPQTCLMSVVNWPI